MFSLQNRRDFLKTTITGLGSFALSGLPLPAFGAPADPDHFFLMIYLEGGFDQRYLFDARPLQMVADKKLVCHLADEPIPWGPPVGQQTLASQLAEPLKPYQDYFSIVNGMIMDANFNGHTQNVTFSFTGNSFGGDSFLPFLNPQGSQRAILDGVQSGDSGGLTTPRNFGQVVPLGGYQGYTIHRLANEGQSPAVAENPAMEFVLQRYLAHAQGSGQFARANQKLVEAFGGVPKLHELIKNIQFTNDDQQPVEVQFVKLLNELFRAKVARTGLLYLDTGMNVDSHDEFSARDYNSLVSIVVQRLVGIIETLRNTQYDSTRSLLDVTTFGFTSEFGRTMLSELGGDFAHMGTDHNQLTNTFLVGGKGIKGGQVIGESDWRTSHEVLSKAHQAMDRQNVKIMGKPYDFQNQQLLGLLPDKFNLHDYISIQNVVNTLLEAFQIGPDKHWAKDRFSGPAPILRSLLK